jgi:hypothetical protein
MNPWLAHFSGQEVKANEKEWKFLFQSGIWREKPVAALTGNSLPLGLNSNGYHN